MGFDGGGAASGAAMGAGIGSFGGPIGIGIGAGIGGIAGGLGAFGSTKKPKPPNIDSELAKIAGLFEQLRAQNTVNINRQAAQGRTAAANNLATRGVYRSGASEHTFNALEGERLNALATADANLAGQEAQTRSALLRELLGLDANNALLDRQAGAARTGQMTGIGANLLMEYLRSGMGGGGGTPAVAPSGLIPGVGYGGYGDGTARGRLSLSRKY